jgi:hypothetical protein
MLSNDPMFSKIAKERFFNFVEKNVYFTETQYSNSNWVEISGVVINKISEIIPSYGKRTVLVVLTKVLMKLGCLPNKVIM